jgi:hypothetical protein
MTPEIYFRMTLRATTMPLHKRLVAFNFWCLKATWRSGYATVCKTVGVRFVLSRPVLPSIDLSVFFRDGIPCRVALCRPVLPSWVAFG